MKKKEERKRKAKRRVDVSGRVFDGDEDEVKVDGGGDSAGQANFARVRVKTAQALDAG